MQLAKRAIVGGNRGSNYYHIYAQLAYGMACYRTGQYDLALERLKTLGDMTKPPSAQFDMSGKVLAAFFVAMSQHRLGNPEAAQEALRIALKYNHMRGDAPNTHQNIFDWLRCDIIESEATKLLQNPLPQSKLPDETNR